jgi:hypothetical protein
MGVPTHISDGQTKNMAMEMLNLSMKGKFVSTFQMERAKNFTPLKNNTKGPNRSTNNNI